MVFLNEIEDVMQKFNIDLMKSKTYQFYTASQNE